jgi:hypothetical protein
MKLVYHGSPTPIIGAAQPRRNVRIRGTKILFNRMSFHATPEVWIALAYIYEKVPGYAMGVNLYSDKKEVLVFGPHDLPDALKVLYGNGGHLYSFPAEKFHWVTGLGTREMISEQPLFPKRTTSISDPVKCMESAGVSFMFQLDRPRP